jgi:hypothetical protein
MRFRAGKYVWAALLIAILATGIGCTKTPNDSQVTQEIQSKLNQDSGLQGKAITVQTSAGVVTLSGAVDNEAQRTAAARYASTTPGIKQVVNNLQVAAASPAESATRQVAEAVPAPPPRRQAKPRPSVSRHRGGSEVPDQNFWDKGSSNKGSADPTAQPKTMADASPAPSPAPAAPAAPPPPPEPKKLTIQSGTTMAIRLVDPIDSETAQAGQTFRATLDSPLASEGEVAIPSGYNVEGHVVDVKSAGKFAGQSLLVLQLDRIAVGGKSYSIETNQFRRQGSNRTTNTAEKVGAGAVIGAIIGGIAGGGKGAGIGAAAGGGLGGGVQAATKGQQIKLPSETVLNFTLESSLTVTKVDQGPGASRHKLDTPQ